MSADIVIEEVPKFVRRYGDYVVEGSNDTIAIFGTDRAKKGAATLDDGLGHLDAQGKGVGTGTIHFIAGRAGKDPDFVNDKSFIYISKKTDVDTNLGLESVESKSNPLPSIVMKSDNIRIVGKNDIKVSSVDGKDFFYLKSQKIKLKVGDNFLHITPQEVFIDIGGASSFKMTNSEIKAVIGSSTLTINAGSTQIKSPKVSTVGGSETARDNWANAIMQAILTHGHMTAMGPTLPVSAGFPPPNPNIIADLAAKYAAFKAATLT